MNGLKRNNIFMLAYITFMLLSVIIRMFLDYALWEPLILAISVSSIFFAADGFCNSVVQSIKNTCDLASEYIAESKRNCHKDALFLEKIEKIRKTYQGNASELPEVVLSHESLDDMHAQMVQGIEQFEADVSSRRTTQKKFEVWANSLAFVGFLVLFIILIIEPYISLPSIVQEMISVVSFAIVLFSQLIDGIADERIKNDINNRKEAIRRQNEVRNVLEEASKKIDEYMALLISNDTETEEEENAD